VNQDPRNQSNASEANSGDASPQADKNTPVGKPVNEPGSEQFSETNAAEGLTTPQEPSSEDERNAEITALRATVESHWDKLLRTNADIDNLRKRNERDLENAHRFALERFIAELLPVKDSMELGLSAATGDSQELGGIREGIELTLKMFSNALEKFAVEELDPQDQVFDPELHQAMTTQDSADIPPGMVMTVIQKGYRLNERLVRPALVIVSK
jgi:molecular chaperone GrpE